MQPKNSTIIVSLCILCYNQEDIIGKTISQGIAQTRSADEILVVDDGSSDRSCEIIGHYPQVRLIRHECNQGRTAARNTLLQHARGDILVYLDGDSFATSDLIEQLLLEYTNEKVGGVGGRGEEKNIGTIYDLWREHHATQSWPQRQESAEFLFGLCFSFRGNLLIQAGSFRSVGEDVDISYRIRQMGYRLVFTPLAYVYHMRTGGRGEVEVLLKK